MSRRKVHSQGSIPFSWESSPGISKFASRDSSVRDTPDSVLALDDDLDSWVREPEIQPPPGTAQISKRCGSARARFCQVQDDPFLAAYKEWMRSGRGVKVPAKVSYCGNEAGYKKVLLRKKGLSMFSCKSSCDVREDNNFVKKLSKNVPPLPLPLPSGRTRPVVSVRNAN